MRLSLNDMFVQAAAILRVMIEQIVPPYDNLFAVQYAFHPFARQGLEAELRENAQRDALAGISNRCHFFDQADRAFAKARANATPLSLLIADIDYFKQYNDTYGHVVGDEVLCLLVQAVQLHIKKADVVGRWGGEEFAVALPGTSSRQALMVAERIRSTLASMALSDRDGNPIPKPTVSQGIATFPQDVNSAPELVDVADQALYVAKQRGRDQIMVAVKSLS